MSDIKIILIIITVIIEISCLFFIMLGLKSKAVLKSAVINVYDDHVEGMVLSKILILAAIGRKQMQLRYDQILHVQTYPVGFMILSQEAQYVCALLNNSESEYVAQLLRQHMAH